jgi:hypothetical protein
MIADMAEPPAINIKVPHPARHTIDNRSAKAISPFLWREGLGRPFPGRLSSAV